MSKLILLVEDSDDDALIFQRMLKKAQLNNPVQRVTTVHDAICYLDGDGRFADRQQFPFPSIVFVDLKLPDKDGFEVLKWVGARPEMRTLLVIVLSGTGRVDDMVKAYRMGANSFLTKPPKPDELNDLSTGFASSWRVLAGGLVPTAGLLTSVLGSLA